jgi:hypothetical protein
VTAHRCAFDPVLRDVAGAAFAAAALLLVLVAFYRWVTL